MPRPRRRLAPAAFALLTAVASAAQTSNPVARISGTEPGSGITYALLSVDGKLSSPAAPANQPPRLTAQCTVDPAGKPRFELLADFGNVPAIAFYPPLKPSPQQPFAPRPVKTNVTMEFLGYVKQKPFKRQWASLLELPEEMRYLNPGMDSANLEPVAYFFQYLRALPTLRLSAPGKPAAEFETSALQAAIKAEPLCRASGL